jgi:outer membrane beta-barrel protein/carboxypeptidase family protein/TonB-dependent receptor-like protein
MRIFTVLPFAFYFMNAIFSPVAVKAQQVAGIVADIKEDPLAGASVDIRKLSDSSVVRYAVTDGSGKYEFTAIDPGTYFLHASHVGYDGKYSAPFVVGDTSPLSLPPLLLSGASEDLKEVVVNFRKPLMEVKADRTVLNVEGSVNAVGQNVLELLGKSPGITVDKDDNISLSGKNGIKVYIDGREVPLTGTDLSDYLKTIQSAEIESIEIISNPSAKYDASGNAGVINIRLKKNKSFGDNGSLSGGYNVGTYSKCNAALGLNHRDDRINIFGNYNYHNGIDEQYMNLVRELTDSLFNQNSVIRIHNTTHSFKAGADYFLDTHNTLGILLNGSFTQNPASVSSSTVISYMPTGVENRILVADNNNVRKRDNANLDLNYRYAGANGREWNMDADYGIYRIRSNQFQPNIYYEPDGLTLLYADMYDLVVPTNINIYSLKTDYVENFGKGKLGFGGKSSYVTSRNDFDQYDVLADGAIPTPDKLLDTLNSSNFNYKENVNAVYGNYDRSFEGWVIQAGLRVENTNVSGIAGEYQLQSNHYQTYDSGFTRHYTDLFPSGSVSYNKNPNDRWTLAFNRRIDRPAYKDLSPFEFRLDEYTYQKGNPQLQPQYTNSIGLTNVYRSDLTTTLNYSHVQGVFILLSDTIDVSRTFFSKENLASADIASLNISYTVRSGGYSAYFNINSFYSIYRGSFGPGRAVNEHAFSGNIYAQQTAKLGRGWTGEVTGYFSTPSIWDGTYLAKASGNVDAGLQKNLLHDRVTLKASVSDIFNTQHYSATSNFAGQYIRATGGSESRQLKLFLTWRFGSTQVKASRQHRTGSEEEDKRVISRY